MCICIVDAVCALGYRILINIPTTTDKKEGEQSRLQYAVVENYLLRIDKNARISTSICTFVFRKITIEIFDVSYWSEQIANAMLLIVLVRSMFLVYVMFSMLIMICKGTNYFSISKKYFVMQDIKWLI